MHSVFRQGLCSDGFEVLVSWSRIRKNCPANLVCSCRSFCHVETSDEWLLPFFFFAQAFLLAQDAANRKSSDLRFFVSDVDSSGVCWDLSRRALQSLALRDLPQKIMWNSLSGPCVKRIGQDVVEILVTASQRSFPSMDILRKCTDRGAWQAFLDALRRRLFQDCPCTTTLWGFLRGPAMKIL